MAVTNQIIIPLVGSREPTLQRNVFVHSTSSLTPRKQPSTTGPLLWKKTSSAFKKFKEKKDKNRPDQMNTLEDAENMMTSLPNKLYKLTKRTQENLRSILNEEDMTTNQCICIYYDPNQAPLYKGQSSDLESEKIESQCHVAMVKRISKSAFKMEEQLLEERPNRIQQFSSKIVEEPRADSKALIRDDDPFIIIRCESRQKLQKSSKTKYIKKQRPFNIKSRHQLLEDKSLRSIIIASQILEKSIPSKQMKFKERKLNNSLFSTPHSHHDQEQVNFTEMSLPSIARNNSGQLLMEKRGENSSGESGESWEDEGQSDKIECE